MTPCLLCHPQVNPPRHQEWQRRSADFSKRGKIIHELLENAFKTSQVRPAYRDLTTRRLNFLRDINHSLIALSFSLAFSLPQEYLNVRGHVRANVTLAGGPGRLTAVMIVMVTSQIFRWWQNLFTKADPQRLLL